MDLQVRAFRIHSDSSDDKTVVARDERAVAAFLRSVQVERIDTAFANGAWNLLVHYHDLKDQEEAAQIASAVASALRDWRSLTAKREGLSASAVLSDDLLERVALAVPTTAIELAELQGGGRKDPGPFAVEIVHVDRSALSDLT